jgi:fatty-acyl-CoA synthase
MECTLNLFTVLDQAASRFPDRGALYHGKRRLCTWLELRERALRIATTIRAQDTPGARIAIASENRPEIVELMFAIWAAACVLVPINYKLHPREMVQILDDAGVSQVFASQKIAAGLATLTGVPIETVDAEGFSRRRAAPPSVPPFSTGPGATDPSTLVGFSTRAGRPGGRKARC